MIMVHRTSKVKMTRNLPTGDNNKKSFGVHKSKSWLEEMDQSIKHKERAMAKYNKELEEAEMEKTQKTKLIEKMQELETEKTEMQREKEAMGIERETQQERALKLAEKEKRLAETRLKKPLMPKIKEAMEVGKKVAKVPEKLFFNQEKKTKKNYKETGIEVV